MTSGAGLLMGEGGSKAFGPWIDDGEFVLPELIERQHVVTNAVRMVTTDLPAVGYRNNAGTRAAFKAL